MGTTYFPGASEIRVTAKSPTRVGFAIAYNSAAATFTIPVKAGTIVDCVKTVVSATFDATSPSLKIGDGSDDDGWLTNSVIALGTANTATAPAVKTSDDVDTNGAVVTAYGGGKYYEEDDTIDFIWDPGTTGTTGYLVGYVEMYNLHANDGIDVT